MKRAAATIVVIAAGLFALLTRLFAAAASPETIAIAYERTFSNDALYGSQPLILVRFVRTPPPPPRRRRATR